MARFPEDPQECGTCGSRLQRVRLSEVEGSAGDTRVELLGFPVRACGEGHERWEAYPDFFPAILDELFHGGGLRFAERQGWFRKSRHCSECSTSLEDVEREDRTVTCPVETERARFELRVTRPMFPCPACGRVQMEGPRSASADEIVEALMDALQGASIERL